MKLYSKALIIRLMTFRKSIKIAGEEGRSFGIMIHVLQCRFAGMPLMWLIKQLTESKSWGGVRYVLSVI